MPRPRSTLKPQHPPVRTTYLISQAWFAMRDLTNAALEKHGVTGIQYTVLSVLDAHENLSPAQLSRRFYVTQQSMGQMLTVLQEGGLLTRTEDPSNRRLLQVSLTAAGRVLVRQCDAEMSAIEDQVLSGFQPRQIEVLRSSLMTIVQRARSHDAAEAV